MKSKDIISGYKSARNECRITCPCSKQNETWRKSVQLDGGFDDTIFCVKPCGSNKRQDFVYADLHDLQQHCQDQTSCPMHAIVYEHINTMLRFHKQQTNEKVSVYNMIECTNFFRVYRYVMFLTLFFFISVCLCYIHIPSSFTMNHTLKMNSRSLMDC